ncbi:MAG: FAD-dependent oxidoreductase [Pseudomonadota bacterium]
MDVYPCPVRTLSERIKKDFASGPISHPRWREATELLLRLVDDISFGRGKPGHIPAMEALAKQIKDAEPDRILGPMVAAFLQEHKPVFLSHIEMHYCPSGECAVLSAAPCQLACPASVDVPSYVALVGAGRYREALEVLWEDLPIPGSLGRVCVHPCENACRRGKVDEPIAVCRLKRVAFDEAVKEGAHPPAPSPQRFHEKVAIIGSGPAGLSTGYFLARRGYRPIIFESMPEPGGMLRWGIPAYRLPRQVLEKEIEHIKTFGVEIRTRMTFGSQITLESLKHQGYRAVFLGTGAWCCSVLPLEWAQDNPNVVECLTFLRFEHLQQSMVGRRVIVIGGGNAAVDCVRTALRLDVDEVNLVYRRSREEMPAHREEVKAAQEEGALLTFLTTPIRIHNENGKLKGLECIRNRLSEPDETGRRRPVPIKGTEHIIPSDTIITAIGQEVDMEPLKRIVSLEITRNRLILVDPMTLETTIPGVFAGGDAASGPATVVEAVAAGKRAVESIHRYLRGLSSRDDSPMPARRQSVTSLAVTAREKSHPSRPVIREISFEKRRRNFKEVELGFTREDATQEAKRCLRCDICINCGRCIEVCSKGMEVDAIHLSYVEEHATPETDFFRPSDKCIGCGSCAVNCPTEAITIEGKEGERIIRMCGGEMSRHELINCAICGEPFVSRKHLDYIHERADAETRIKYPRNLCPACARRARVEKGVGQIGFY